VAQFFETVVENRFRYDNRISRTKAPMDKPTYTPPEPYLQASGVPGLEFYEPPLFTHDQLIQAHAAGLAQGRSEAASKLAQAVARQTKPGFWPAPLEPTKAMLDAARTACEDKFYPQDMYHGPRAADADKYRAMRDAHTAAD
jgi:hypothetical protein